jgi:hypothetical protein
MGEPEYPRWVAAMDDPERAIAASWLKFDIQFAQIPGQVTVINGRVRHLKTCQAAV